MADELNATSKETSTAAQQISASLKQISTDADPSDIVRNQVVSLFEKQLTQALTEKLEILLEQCDHTMLIRKLKFLPV